MNFVIFLSYITINVQALYKTFLPNIYIFYKKTDRIVNLATCLLPKKECIIYLLTGNKLQKNHELDRFFY